MLNFKLNKKITYCVVIETISEDKITGRREIKQKTSTPFNSRERAQNIMDNLKNSLKDCQYFLDAYIFEAY